MFHVAYLFGGYERIVNDEERAHGGGLADLKEKYERSEAARAFFGERREKADADKQAEAMWKSKMCSAIPVPHNGLDPTERSVQELLNFLEFLGAQEAHHEE